MMSEDIRQFLLSKPFEPFRLHVTEGSTYDIFHPDAVFVTRTYIVIAPIQWDRGLHEGFVKCDPLHITRITPIDDEKKTHKRNGKRRK